jgi:hypothetical protein
MQIDPRPSYMQRKCPIHDEKSAGLQYGIELWDHEVKYEIKDKSFFILEVYLLPINKGT